LIPSTSWGISVPQFAHQSNRHEYWKYFWSHGEDSMPHYTCVNI
jgi:hypothetical protein